MNRFERHGSGSPEDMSGHAPLSNAEPVLKEKDHNDHDDHHDSQSVHEDHDASSFDTQQKPNIEHNMYANKGTESKQEKDVEQDTDTEDNPAYDILDYTIPVDIEAIIPPYFYAAFAGELFSTYGWERSRDIFYPDRPLSAEYHCDLHSGNGLWYAAFKATCRKFGLDALLTYYNNLPWYYSDQFDGFMEERINRSFTSEAGNGAKEYVQYLEGLGVNETSEQGNPSGSSVQSDQCGPIVPSAPKP